jgi:hypothetical protein
MGKAQIKGKIAMITEDIQVVHQFTDKERGLFSLAQANALDERDQVEMQLTQAKKQFAAQIAEADAIIRKISLQIRTGTELRNVRCILIDHRPDQGYRLVVRTDNGCVFRRRKLEPHERQMTLLAGQQQAFVAAALLPVEDKGWDQHFVTVPLWQEEVDELKLVEPPVPMRPMIPTTRGIEAPKTEPEAPIPTAERIVHEDAVICEWCEAGYPFDPIITDAHLVPQGGDKSPKRRTCKKKKAEA